MRIVTRGRPAVAAAEGRARGVGLRPGRTARRRHRQRLRAEQDASIFCYAERTSGGGRTAVARARLERRQRPARRGQGHLPAGRPAVVGQSLWLPHRAGQRRQPVRHAGRSFQPARRGAEPRQPSRQDRSASRPTARRRRTIRSSAATGAKPEIWSYGHRNEQGLAINPATGELWEIEHGPRGGDEVNIIGKGKNYGWPVIGYGIDYCGAKIHDGTAKDGMEQPVKYWVPSIAPVRHGVLHRQAVSEMDAAACSPARSRARCWCGCRSTANSVTGEERLLQNLNERIRDVRQGPDGALWLLTDNSAGRILRVSPAAK